MLKLFVMIGLAITIRDVVRALNAKEWKGRSIRTMVFMFFTSICMAEIGLIIVLLYNVIIGNN